MRRADFTVQGDPGVSLAVREVRSGGPVPAKAPVLLLHGAKLPARASFDLSVTNSSLVGDLTQASPVRRVEWVNAPNYAHLDRPEHGRSKFVAEVTGFLAKR